MKHLLTCIGGYEEYKWYIFGDQKFVGFLLSLQLGYTERMSFLHWWNIGPDELHCSTIVWSTQTNFNPGRHNMKHTPLDDATKIYLPALHVKLCLFKNFVKHPDREKEFTHTCQKFSPKSEAKLKQEIFVGPEIKKLWKVVMLYEKLAPKELLS